MQCERHELQSKFISKPHVTGKHCLKKRIIAIVLNHIQILRNIEEVPIAITVQVCRGIERVEGLNERGDIKEVDLPIMIEICRACSASLTDIDYPDSTAVFKAYKRVTVRMADRTYV